MLGVKSICVMDLMSQSWNNNDNNCFVFSYSIFISLVLHFLQVNYFIPLQEHCGNKCFTSMSICCWFALQSFWLSESSCKPGFQPVISTKTEFTAIGGTARLVKGLPIKISYVQRVGIISYSFSLHLSDTFLVLSF